MKKTIQRNNKTYRLTAATKRGVPMNDAYFNIEYLRGLGFNNFVTIVKNGEFYNYARKEK